MASALHIFLWRQAGDLMKPSSPFVCVALFIVVSLTTLPLKGQEKSGGPPLTAGSELFVERSNAPDRPYSEAFAFWSSFFSTLMGGGVGVGLIASEPEPLGIAMVGLGTSLGPSVGHIYADNWRYGLVSAGGRALLFTASVLGIRGAAVYGRVENDTAKRGLGTLGAVMASGVAVWAVFDILTSRRAARRANAGRDLSLSVTPSLRREDESLFLGLEVAAAF